jgi:type IX secretion system PorP/SprF family membrane protein
MKNLVKYITLTAVIIFMEMNANAQQQMENSMSQYFRNRTLWNAGFTGIDRAKIYAMQNRSWVGFDGAPVMTNISGELNFGENSSAGLQIMSDVTGLLYRTFGVLNYAYRVKLQEERQFRIGISLALSGDRLNSKYIDQGGAVDPLIMNNINSNAQFDGNLGIVYKSKKLAIGASFYRLKENFKSGNNNAANLAFAQLGGTYDIFFNNNEQVNLMPLLQLRFYRETKPVYDVGAQFEYKKLINFMAVYQSTGNIRTGTGFSLKKQVAFNFFYNTNIKVANASSQQYEIGLGLGFSKDK